MKNFWLRMMMTIIRANPSRDARTAAVPICQFVTIIMTSEPANSVRAFTRLATVEFSCVPTVSTSLVTLLSVSPN